MPNPDLPEPLASQQSSLHAEIQPRISLVVPTYKRPALLKNLLDSLLKQSLSPQEYEVIVVDNAPEGDAGTAALCQMPAYTALRLRYAHHPVPGASEARNCGISLVQSQWIGFLDDDIVLPEFWLEKTLEIAASAQANIFGGPYLPYYTEGKPAWFRDEYAILSMGEHPNWLSGRQYLLGGNMVWLHSVVQALEGFSTRIGRVGNNYEYGEETEFQVRAMQSGQRLWYDPTLIAYHYNPVDRMSLRWLAASKWFHGKAKARIFLNDFVGSDPRPKYRIVASWTRSAVQDVFRILGLVARIPFRDRSRYPYGQNFIVEMILPRVSAFSTAFYVARYLLHS
jgi:glucosyl-dolichyl phosphate glucuronosyltransferase